jgi:hypothetical protein
MDDKPMRPSLALEGALAAATFRAGSGAVRAMNGESASA